MIAALLLALTAQDPMRCSFIVVGCNRLAEKPWQKQKAENPSSANLPQLNQTFTDVENLPSKPWAFFMVGDLVMNMAHDNGEALKGQLDGWADVVRKSPIEGKLEMVAVPGNHELLWKHEEGKVKEEFCNPPCDTVWNEWLARNPDFAKHAGNGPNKTDGVADDQSKLSYSFDRDGEHYIVLNSDTLTNDIDPATSKPRIGLIPFAWLKKDLAKADANPAVRDVFIMAHRPIVSIKSNELSSTIDPSQLDETRALVKGSKKFRIWCCAHIHGWDLREIGGGKWQVISGNGGSKLEEYWQPKEGQYFGFSEVRVYKSGKISVIGYRRPMPPGDQKEYETGPVPPEPAKPSAEVWVH